MIGKQLTRRAIAASASSIAAWLMVAFFVTGCGGGNDDSAATQEGADSGTPAALSTAGDEIPAPSGDVVAEVNGTKIYASELERVLTNFKRQNLSPADNVEGDTVEERLRNTSLKVLIEQALVNQAAAAEGISVTDAEVQTSLSQLKVQTGGDVRFKEALATAGVTEAEVARDLRDNLIIRQYFDRHLTVPTITDEDLKAFYDAHPERYGARPEVQAQHILIRTDPAADDITKADILSKANAVLEELRGGADFAEMVAKHSQDETNNQTGGELGWFGPGAMVAPFDSAAFALKPGEISGLVKTQFGYHILRVMDRRQAEPQPFEQMKPYLTGLVRQEKTNEANQALVDSLRQAAQVKVF